MESLASRECPHNPGCPLIYSKGALEKQRRTSFPASRNNARYSSYRLACFCRVWIVATILGGTCRPRSSEQVCEAQRRTNKR